VGLRTYQHSGTTTTTTESTNELLIIKYKEYGKNMCQHNFEKKSAWHAKTTFVSVVLNTRTHFTEAVGRPIGT